MGLLNYFCLSGFSESARIRVINVVQSSCLCIVHVLLRQILVNCKMCQHVAVLSYNEYFLFIYTKL